MSTGTEVSAARHWRPLVVSTGLFALVGGGSWFDGCGDRPGCEPLGPFFVLVLAMLTLPVVAGVLAWSRRRRPTAQPAAWVLALAGPALALLLLNY